MLSSVVYEKKFDNRNARTVQHVTNFHWRLSTFFYLLPLYIEAFLDWARLPK